MTIPAEFVADEMNERTAPEIEAHHLKGVPWWDAVVPRRWHRCRPQTIAYVNYVDTVERCACGAMRMRRGGWAFKNERSRP